MKRICKMCGKNEVAERWVKELCKKHYNSYVRAKERLPNHLERARNMQELVWLVEGKPTIELNTSSTTYIMPIGTTNKRRLKNNNLFLSASEAISARDAIKKLLKSLKK